MRAKIKDKIIINKKKLLKSFMTKKRIFDEKQNLSLSLFILIYLKNFNFFFL